MTDYTIDTPPTSKAFDMSHWEVGQPFVVEQIIDGETVVGEYTIQGIVPDLNTDLMHTVRVLKSANLVDNTAVTKLFMSLANSPLGYHEEPTRVIQLLASFTNLDIDNSSLLEQLVQKGAPATFTNIVVLAAEQGQFSQATDVTALIAALKEGADDRFYVLVDYRDDKTDYSQFATPAAIPLKVNNALGSKERTHAVIMGINSDMTVQLAPAA